MTAVEFVTVLMITLLFIILAFIAGLKLAGYYYRNAEADKKSALQRQYLRLMVHADADDPVGPYKFQLPPEFHTRLKQTGRATVSINSNSK